MTVTIYGIKNCDTMKKAFTWLGGQSVDFTFHDYRVAGITRAEVAAWVAEAGLDKVLNKASKTFRALPEAVRDGLDEARAIDLMVAEPTMIKRPVLVMPHGIEVGFKPERYATIFGSTPLTGDGHSSDTVDDTVPTALSQDSHAVILKIPEAIRSA